MVANEGIMTEERVVVKRRRKRCSDGGGEADGPFSQILVPKWERVMKQWRRDLERTRKLNQWLTEGRR